jgi:hypothetical protein
MALSLLGVCAEWHSLHSEYAQNGTVFTQRMRGMALSLLEVCAEWGCLYGVCAEWHCLYAEYAQNDTHLTHDIPRMTLLRFTHYMKIFRLTIFFIQFIFRMM